MKQGLDIKKGSNKWRIVLVVVGVVFNVLLFFISNRFGLPFFLDTIGTIVAAGIGGLFPGILTAVLSNTLCAVIDTNSLYFMFVNVLVAIYASWYGMNYSFKRIDKAVIFAVTSGLASGLLGAIIQNILFGAGQNEIVSELSTPLQDSFKLSPTVAFFVGNILINLLDKTITTIIAFLVIVFTPENEIVVVRNSGWKQKPLSGDELRRIRSWVKDVKLSARTRMTVTLVSASLILVFIMGWIGVSLYFENEKNARVENAWNALEFTATMMDPSQISNFIKDGGDSQEYLMVGSLLSTIKENAYGVSRLYVIIPENNGLRYVFDFSSDEDEVTYEAGQLVPYEEIHAFDADLFDGELAYQEIRGLGNWKMSLFYPLKNSIGSTVCYLAADVSLAYMADYMRIFVFKVAIILAGFFVLIVAYALWTTDVFSTYPISSMAEILDRFSKGSDSQEQMDENVREIRALDIHTGDETEMLYQSICSLILSQAEQMRSIRRLSESTAKMQDGLIMTMADMVENRDLDMGAHIQRTTAYVRIVAESLKKKGYYPEKLTPKFMSDIVRSAPLYDVGKIKVPDEILKKPGELTKEEFEIIKTHVTEGKKILENAISTSNGDNYLKEARNMAAYHHERWDGTGYPEGLHGEVIPLSARIMAIADVFDDITSDRVYRKAMSLDKALEVMNGFSGTVFDPKCLEAFMDALPEIKVIMMKYGDQNV
ncbi:HD domain-containing phosphohydrolase [Butyrivibrio sp. VCB2006]|uniref:HD domain-containing phosphohydrolase n=1 Tax=Butyrivibrio sp. VCB2006 TaxID=1280679 RepID=UPI0004927BB5|nr:HD domain-containing phosphohydrolase [Butyrivibrio sp. VCB2006]